MEEEEKKFKKSEKFKLKKLKCDTQYVENKNICIINDSLIQNLIAQEKIIDLLQELNSHISRIDYDIKQIKQNQY